MALGIAFGAYVVALLGLHALAVSKKTRLGKYLAGVNIK